MVPLSVNVNTLGGTNYTLAWIDWNQNGEFENSESINLGTVTGGDDVNSGIVANVLVPVDAELGNTIMRVRTNQSTSIDETTPCDSIQNGEAEDYSILVNENLNLVEDVNLNNQFLISTNTEGIHFKVFDIWHFIMSYSNVSFKRFFWSVITYFSHICRYISKTFISFSWKKSIKRVSSPFSWH